jgi:hypothetical protein
MHLIRLDIDRKNAAAHLQVGPLGGGLNAVYAPLQGGSATMARFVRSILFRGNYVNEVFETDEGESIDGSMQWVDATGHVRQMSFAGGSAMLPGGFVNSPLHPSQRTLHQGDRDRIRGLGNIFWEGDDGDARWDEMRGDILGMLFCSALGSVSPEKLWWSASRLGVHAPARNELDEGYQSLKAEERDLLDRLRNADAVDHDRAWWALERDRILAEIEHIHHVNHLPNRHTERTQPSILTGLRERLATIHVELSHLKNAHQDLIVAEANAKLDSMQDHEASSLDAFRSGVSDHVIYPRTRSDRPQSNDYSTELNRVRSRLEKLNAEKADVELQLQHAQSVATSTVVASWDDSQLRQQLAHAEDMLRRWDRRAQWHRRLAEVQSHLRTRSPYRRTSEGSLIPLAEKYLRELTAGAARQLPPWAVESSYLRGTDMPVDFDIPMTELNGRDTYYDRRLPAADSRQRRLVDLAIRLAIAERAVPRIGRIPFLFDQSVEVFRGEALEQILHVLAGFARDGRQILMATHDEFIARRIAAHGGTVCRMHEILRYARPSYSMDSFEDLGIHPSLHQSAPNFAVDPSVREAANSGYYTPFYSSAQDYADINRQLSGWANESDETSWWNTVDSNASNSARPTGIRPAPIGVRNSRFHLHLDSPIDQVPTVDPALAVRFLQAGVHRVGDLLRTPPESLGVAMRTDENLVYYLQCVAELMTATPMLRPFDARVLVGCGITRSHMLRDLEPNQLVDRVDAFLRSGSGQELLRTARPFEVNRIREWVASMKRSTKRRRSALDLDRASADFHRTDAGPCIRTFEPRLREERASKSSASNEREMRDPKPAVNGRTVQTNAMNSRWKFHLDTESPVVDAPSIGPKMASKLAAISIQTVGDLLATSAETISAQLEEKSVSEESVRDWQRQALLVCRVPNLRGHDAQLIVGVGIVEAEELGSADIEALFEKVARFASSKAGVRILRGSDAPTREEVQEWIHWAQNCRAVRAA